MTKELPCIVTIAALAIASNAPIVRAEDGATCRPVDLRSERVAPVRSQIFVDAAGERRDSGMCHAFAAANLAGQVVGTSVSPLTISFHNLTEDAFNEGFGSDLVMQSAFTDASGSADDDLRLAMKTGLCSAARLDAFLGTTKQGVSSLQALYDYVRTHASDQTVDETTAWLDETCQDLVPLTGFDVTTVKLDVNPQTRDPARTHEALETIDRVLDDGRLLAMGDGSHVVTIVGRTADCELLIQDSLPKSWLDTESNRPVELAQLAAAGKPITYVSEHLQAWSRAAMAERLRELVYLTPSARETRGATLFVRR